MKKLEFFAMVGCGAVDDEGLHYLGNGCLSLQVIHTFANYCDELEKRKYEMIAVFGSVLS